MKALLGMATACAAALALAAPALAADRVIERGIVQSVGPSAVVLRALDGTDVTVPVGPATRVRLNGRAAALAAVSPGLVAEAVRVGSGTAVALRAFGRASGRVERGRLVRVLPRALVLRRGPGDTVRVRISGRTVVWRGTRTADAALLRRGMQVMAVLSPAGAARVILVQGGGRHGP
ncbi:MAG TPA: hypothetical protein VH968_07910 [Gaiellaceae bacterium]